MTYITWYWGAVDFFLLIFFVKRQGKGDIDRKGKSTSVVPQVDYLGKEKCVLISQVSKRLPGHPQEGDNVSVSSSSCIALIGSLRVDSNTATELLDGSRYMNSVFACHPLKMASLTAVHVEIGTIISFMYDQNNHQNAEKSCQDLSCWVHQKGHRPSTMCWSFTKYLSAGEKKRAKLAFIFDNTNIRARKRLQPIHPTIVQRQILTCRQ